MPWTKEELERLKRMRAWVNNVKIWQVWKHPRLLRILSELNEMERIKLKTEG